jgi:hypothetical protein
VVTMRRMNSPARLWQFFGSSSPDDAAMLTDDPPRKANHRTGFLESDRIKTLGLPQDGRLLRSAKSIEAVMK